MTIYVKLREFVLSWMRKKSYEFLNYEINIMKANDKKLLAIVVLGLLWSGTAYAKIDWQKRNLCEDKKYIKMFKNSK